jgi:hypothetical protein
MRNNNTRSEKQLTKDWQWWLDEGGRWVDKNTLESYFGIGNITGRKFLEFYYNNFLNKVTLFIVFSLLWKIYSASKILLEDVLFLTFSRFFSTFSQTPDADLRTLRVTPVCRPLPY